ncbi:hypothetical protein BC834DRAFT_976698 [Gloeopeniophorella convolvens]|nr:hypothetical protein BC834DRAFT_976698 [Gloeopeniophorella convolvens]
MEHPHYMVADLIDDEAEVNYNKEEDVDDDEGLEGFLDDSETLDARSSPPSTPSRIRGHGSPFDPDSLDQEAAEIRARYGGHKAPHGPQVLKHESHAPQAILHPTASDDGVFAICVRNDAESYVLHLLKERWRAVPAHSVPVKAAFTHASIPGYLLVEASSPADAIRSVEGFSAVFHSVPPCLIALDGRHELLARPRQSTKVTQGQWVRCTRGRYKDDVSFSSSLTVSSGKRKHVTHPDPHLWFFQDLVHSFGVQKVTRAMEEESVPYTFAGEMFECGLVMKPLSLECVEPTTSIPERIGVFAAISAIRAHPLFHQSIVTSAQDALKPGDRVQVIQDEFVGSTGTMQSNFNSVMRISGTIPQQGGERIFELHVRTLCPYFLPGDHIKSRFRESAGMVVSVSPEKAEATYMDSDTHEEITVSVYYITFSEPDLDFAHIVPGARTDSGTVTIKADNTFEGPSKKAVKPVKAPKHQVQLLKTEGPSTARIRVHPLINKPVVIKKGPFKGYRTIVKTVSPDGPTVELAAKLSQHGSKGQQIPWAFITSTPSALEAAGRQAELHALRVCMPPLHGTAREREATLLPSMEEHFSQPSTSRNELPQSSVGRFSHIQRDGECWMLLPKFRRVLNTRAFVCNVHLTGGTFQGGIYD